MNHRRGYLLALSSTLLFSTTGIFIKYLLLHYDLQPFTLAFWRVLIVSSAMLGMLGLTRPAWLRIRWQDLPFYLAYGLIGVALSQTLWIYSVSLNGAALATVLLYIQIAFVTILSRWLFAEPITRLKQLALFLTLLGCALVSQVYDATQFRLGLPGVLCGFASGLTYSGYTLFSKMANRRHHPWVAMAYAFAFGALFLAFTQRRADIFTLGDSVSGWAVLAFMALVPTLGGYGLYTLSLRDLPASVAGLILPLELVFASVIAFAAFGEMMEPLQILGALLIAVSVVLLRPRRSLIQNKPNPSEEGA